MKVERIWTTKESSQQNKLLWWEFGDEQWCLLSDKTIKHIKILSRKVVSKDPFTLVEEVLLLPETPVPLEANQQEATGWQLTEKVLAEKKEPLLQLPLPLPLPSPQSQTTQNSKKPQQAQPLLNYTLPETHLQSNLESVEVESSQFSVSLPTELWLSLSQWIPPNALFQPSLHHQAILELSDKPIQTFVPQRVQGNYSQPQPMRHQYGGREMPPRHAHEVSGGFSHKQRVYRQDYSAKPLFV
jgi:hypothetical protein